MTYKIEKSRQYTSASSSYLLLFKQVLSTIRYLQGWRKLWNCGGALLNKTPEKVGVHYLALPPKPPWSLCNFLLWFCLLPLLFVSSRYERQWKIIWRHRITSSDKWHNWPIFLGKKFFDDYLENFADNISLLTWIKK